MSANTRHVIDLNAPLGIYRDLDSHWITIISSGHLSGLLDDEDIHDIVTEALDYGVSIGASVEYPKDYKNSVEHNRGKKSETARTTELAALRDVFLKQITKIANVCLGEGSNIAYIKAEGALYDDAARDSRLGETLLDAIFELEENLVYGDASNGSFEGDIPILGLPHSVLPELAKACGRTFYSEAYVSRNYAGDGLLLPLWSQGSASRGLDEASARLLSLLREGVLRLKNGSTLFLQPESIALSSIAREDLRVAQGLQSLLLEAGFQIKGL